MLEKVEQEKNKEGFSLAVKEEISSVELRKDLSDLGYTFVSTSIPNRPGEFASRGNLLDLWLERYKNPVRIDLIGDKIENIYLFNPITQTKIKNLKEVYIVSYGSIPKLPASWFQKAKFPSQQGSYERLFLSEIGVGDLVVHIDHGVGRFVGVSEKQSTDISGQNLIIEYAKGDKLFVPVGQIDRVTKYIGVGGRPSSLATLGTSRWEQTKQKVQESIFAYARQLLELYAKREIAARQPYSEDTPWQKQLEESFEYEETQDQLQAVNEIKTDLASNHPMDRLLVGDVGFGKTEVAIRAAFKVVQDGKQVALIVPTTVLAQQHFHLFADRLKEFPVKVGKLSRFESDPEQKTIIQALKEGEIDVIIGTHRLLSADVEFKNLGLLVIDEEHRFGVKAKEKIKTLRPNIDVLSMSATPIPRTLQMSLAKLRNMSVLTQAPTGRQPISTSVSEFSEEKVIQVIKREIDRGGQVYYLYNHVEKMEQKVAQLKNLLPKYKIIFAHGQMDRQGFGNLEGVMDRFYEREYDILVCTTIIGSGLDMPNVNTIIIEEAQKFGLADLYQLRGRVGRSNRQAYALLFYPEKYIPTGDSLERLVAIASASELGSGFKLAQQDLQIRGAGNLLGTDQHGNVSLVGFELYLQLLSQAVEKLKD
jgi:transcription-repair coupling factor (superfamily II helicase)